jgi:hypothetical protein
VLPESLAYIGYRNAYPHLTTHSTSCIVSPTCSFRYHVRTTCKPCSGAQSDIAFRSMISGISAIKVAQGRHTECNQLTLKTCVPYGISGFVLLKPVCRTPSQVPQLNERPPTRGPRSGCYRHLSVHNTNFSLFDNAAYCIKRYMAEISSRVSRICTSANQPHCACDTASSISQRFSVLSPPSPHLSSRFAP